MSSKRVVGRSKDAVVLRVWIVEQGTWRSEQWVSFIESVWRTQAAAHRHCRADGFKHDKAAGSFYRGEERTRRFVEPFVVESENPTGQAVPHETARKD